MKYDNLIAIYENDQIFAPASPNDIKKRNAAYSKSLLDKIKIKYHAKNDIKIGDYLLTYVTSKTKYDNVHTYYFYIINNIDYVSYKLYVLNTFEYNRIENYKTQKSITYKMKNSFLIGYFLEDLIDYYYYPMYQILSEEEAKEKMKELDNEVEEGLKTIKESSESIFKPAAPEENRMLEYNKKKRNEIENQVGKIEVGDYLIGLVAGSLYEITNVSDMSIKTKHIGRQKHMAGQWGLPNETLILYKNKTPNYDVDIKYWSDIDNIIRNKDYTSSEDQYKHNTYSGWRLVKHNDLKTDYILEQTIFKPADENEIERRNNIKNEMDYKKNQEAKEKVLQKYGKLEV